MTRINSKLLDAIRQRSGLSPSAAYGLISRKANSERLPNDLAAIATAADLGISINRFATPEQLLALRASNSARSSTSPSSPSTEVRQAVRRVARTKGKAKKKGKKIFVVHGRDQQARTDLFSLLRAFGLEPIEFHQAIGKTRKASPYVGEILSAAFREANAIVVLFTPDDEVKLRKRHWTNKDKADERELTGQARPNVLFEAGMAFGSHPDQTVLVQVGDVKKFSDIGGRHICHLSNNAESRADLATKLANAGCDVDLSGSDWMNVGDFER